MFDITKIDKNFKVGNTLNIEGIRFYSCLEKPFSLHGIEHDGNMFYRMPLCVASKVNEGVKNLCSHTAGGRVRFKTNSPYVAISVKYAGVCKMPHFAFCGSIFTPTILMYQPILLRWILPTPTRELFILVIPRCER